MIIRLLLFNMLPDRSGAEIIVPGINAIAGGGDIYRSGMSFLPCIGIYLQAVHINEERGI